MTVTVPSTPPFSPLTGHLLGFLFGFAYVGSLYVSNSARLKFEATPPPISAPVHVTANASSSTTTAHSYSTSASTSVGNTNGQTANANANANVAAAAANADYPRQKLAHERWRDDPDVIRARLTAVCVASAVCCLMVVALVWKISGASSVRDLPSVLSLSSVYLGFHLDSGFWSFLPHLVVPLLFLGPLYATFLAETLPGQRYWSFDVHVGEYFFSWVGLRSYILGPITEEIVFRSCVLAAFHMAGVSRSHMVFLSPLPFGLAHVHHAWDTYNRYGRTPAALKRAVIGSLFQFAFTSLFGFLSAYLFVQTGSVLAPISAHMFCNTMGFPNFAGDVRGVEGKVRVSVVVAYVVGVGGFWAALGRWTGVGEHREFWL